MDDKQQVTDNRPQIKICGLTRVDEAVGCAARGADAIGLVFYPKSPRHLTEDQAREICLALPEEIATVGVFVNESFATIMRKVEHCRLKAVQIHGQETPELVDRLRGEGLIVIKALFIGGQPALGEASHYNASAFLVECAQGTLPGGNALQWNWADAKGLGAEYPLVVAGGLAPDNVAQAIADSEPDAVDVSSGVEAGPGRKDLQKVGAFIEAVARCDFDPKTGREKLRAIF